MSVIRKQLKITIIAENSSSVNIRNSFDRFGDDLCELILQYLSLNDKIKFECVSKQWKRFIFKRQLRLHITNIEYDSYRSESNESSEESSDESSDESSNKSSEESSDESSDESSKEWSNIKPYDRDYRGGCIGTVDELAVQKIIRYYKRNEKTVIKVIDNLLNKCPFITSIIIGDNIDDKILMNIIDKCNHLTTVEFESENYEQNTFIYLGQKCGNNLKSIRFKGQLSLYAHYSTVKRRELLELCPNLLRIKNCDISTITVVDEVLVPKLCDVRPLRIGNITDLNDFIYRYANTLKVLELIINDIPMVLGLQINQLNRLSKLTKLKITMKNSYLHPILDEIAEIGRKCDEVKYLEINIKITDQSLYDEYRTLHNRINIFTELLSFNQLTHLKLSVPYYSVDNIEDHFTAGLIKHCNNLTYINMRASISDTFFADIHQYLPKLNVINIDTFQQLTDAALNSLAKLTHLTSLKVTLINDDVSLITENGINEITQNCVHLKSFTLKAFPNIKIKKLIQIAHKNPRINFKYITSKIKKYRKACNSVRKSRFEPNIRFAFKPN